MRQTIVSLASGILFGAGLAISGMIDPARVRAFLDVGGAWDPTLAFVMGGALVPMALAWAIVRRRSRPVAAAEFHLPATTPVDARLIAGAALFGAGWGLAGLCPGPAIAALAIRPVPAAVFCLGMAAGFGLFRLLPEPRTRQEETRHDLQAAG
ncbi:MAG: YeeE/YedE family protein [Methylorubrum populi]